MEIDKLIQEIVDIIGRRAPKETQVILFGSWAKGTAQKTSDLDIGILGKAAITNLIMTQIISEVSALPTLRKIDIVDLNTVDERFRESALNGHKILTNTL